MFQHQSDCATNGFDMPNVGIVHADHCSCSESEWLCPRCGVRLTVPSDIVYVEHWCADNLIQSLNVVEVKI